MSWIAGADRLEQCDLIRAGAAARLAGDDFRELVDAACRIDRVLRDDRIAGLAEHAFARIYDDARAAAERLLVDLALIAPRACRQTRR